MSYLEQRRSIMELADTLTRKRMDLISAINSINISITALVRESERLLMSAVAEAERTGGKKPVATQYAEKDPSPEDIADHTSPRTVHCSNCGQPGHKATTCTNERKVEEKKPRKKRAPLTDEQRAVLAARLVKARAKKGKKK